MGWEIKAGECLKLGVRERETATSEIETEFVIKLWIQSCSPETNAGWLLPPLSSLTRNFETNYVAGSSEHIAGSLYPAEPSALSLAVT